MITEKPCRLPALLAAFAALGLAYSLVTPLFEAPDEVWHYAYVRYLAEEGVLPPLNAGTPAYQQVAQPPLYYAVAAWVSGSVPDEDLEDLMWHNPGFGYQAGGTVNDNKNMLIHTEREAFPWRGAVLAVRLARLVSLAFGLLAVVAAWGLGREAFPQHPNLALGVAAVVAFTPQFLFISSVASNDSAAAALSTAALWMLARIANYGPTLRRSLVAGVLIGLAALSKTSCLLLLLPAALTLALTPRHSPPSILHSPFSILHSPFSILHSPFSILHSPSPIRHSSSIIHHLSFVICHLSFVIRHLSFIILASFAVGGWWYLRNAVLYGDPFGFGLHANTPWGRATPASLTMIVAELPAVYRSFWGAFGWGHVEYPAWVYMALGVFVIAGLVGWGGVLKTRRLPGRGRVLLLAAVWCALVFAALLAWMWRIEAPHGRLLFPALGTWAVLLVGGWSSLPRITHHASRIMHFAPLLCLFALSLLTPWTTIWPAFAPPRLLSPVEAAATVEDVGFIYGGVARLLGIALDRPSVAPGDVLAVRACWEALTPMEADYTVFVHLVGRNNVRVAERHTYPGLGRFPTSLWPVGQAFCDVYRMRVEEWAPVPELYDLVIGLYDLPGGERLIARDTAGAIVEFPTPTQVRVAPRQPLAVSPQHSLDYRLGGEITLLGYDLSGPLRGNVPLTVTLYWRAEMPPQGNYVVFVHLLDEGGRQLAQHDGVPRYGRYPTLAWHAGDVVPDEHVLDMPPSLPGKRLFLAVGMYRPETMERLPVVGPAGPLPDDLISLAIP